ncbi:MAG: LytTR family transcriptional regulator [Bacteroidales bacterium]|nr:LytTR family transcriptional regulator [Bacteroidales bacterium]MBQ1754298.1 LytTR family transcriptional regulator [Bacteroidales bacterium]MBQ2149745.1 LytTR family transcriptional regulator [Bacteroidales bacterium]MBQ2194369.1 LytTR family transcriptional regulator [Bacteroidales bacterium]MBQ5435543.1 LytTR family transcriptional regulator [Bacteroidales bacterium]
MEAPKYLLHRTSLLESVAFVVAFSFLFLITYHPFSNTNWLGLKPDVLVPTILFYLCSVGILLISKAGLMLYQIRHTVSVRKYLFWFLGEFVVIAVVYLLFTQHWFESDIPITFRLVARASLCVGMILSIPYLIFGLLASNRAKTEEIDALKLSLKDQTAAQSTNLVHFYDFNGVLRISIEVEKIYYIASQDNYVEIRYEMGGKLLNYLLRCRTTRLEKQLESTPLVRCHRSYIVNVDNVTQFKREKANAFLVLSHPEAKRIPVSKSYYKTIAEKLDRTAS